MIDDSKLDLTSGVELYAGSYIIGSIVTLPVLLLLAYLIARRLTR